MKARRRFALVISERTEICQTGITYDHVTLANHNQFVLSCARASILISPYECLSSQRTSRGMHPFVRDLYKRFLVVGRDYPGGLQVVRARTKEAFFKKRGVATEDELMHAVAAGRRMVRELEGITQLAKYRAMRARYGAGATGQSYDASTPAASGTEGSAR